MRRNTQLIFFCLSLFCHMASGSFLRMMNHKLNLGSQLSSNNYEPPGGLEIKVLEGPPSLSSSNRFARRKSTQSHRYVFAHIVQGNFQVYQADDWKADMELAKASGIDAFAINIGRDTTNAKQLPLAYDVADSIGFSLFLSFDMVYYGQADSSRDVIQLIRAYSKRKSQFRYQGKPLVSTFSGEVAGTFLDNNPDYNGAWQSLKNKIGFPIYFLPAWTGAQPSTASSADGVLSWDAWSSASSSPDEKNRRIFAAAGKQYAAPISPFFFKHLEQGEGGNYIHSNNDQLVIERYLQLIRSPPAFIELLTWNDYGESHYLRDPRPSANLPKGVISAHDYVDGFPHEPLLDMLSHFNLWYKHGSQPKISKSKVYMWYRPHPKGAQASSDPLSIPRSANECQDNLYIFLIVAAEKKLTKIVVESGKVTYSKNLVKYFSKSENTLIRFSIPFQPGEKQSVRLFDSTGKEAANLIGIPIEPSPNKYNFNYWSGMATF
ncbi:hypothetical protein CROQUDRAFT_45976 [Cronartium quercuum f. sp. fusiforme G11]|uniref:Glycoside hydrolase family 71 protein n=1 Tax=Cronartium quercuum f. sp. fusiforme G11 TaxID=708437 RepID=A0A9P6NGQ5_9BASI|nr:hypothetical protein CROQUDRAFT_45976 [Cronartium quercuum f. sp. fusiforme G11]